MYRRAMTAAFYFANAPAGIAETIALIADGSYRCEPAAGKPANMVEVVKKSFEKYGIKQACADRYGGIYFLTGAKK